MEYRELGKTGWKVSVLGFGASPLGGVFGEVSQEEATSAVHTALELGINFFDVAPYYGLTKAETALGNAMANISRSAYYLATKVGRYGSADFDFSAERILRSVDESLSRLKTDYIDLIQCHDIEFGSLDQVINETLPALQTLKAEGKVRAIGISGLPLNIFTHVLDRAETDTVLSYCHYSLNDTTLAALLPYFAEKQVGIINAAPLSMGLLSHTPPPVWHPAPVELQEACARAAASCHEQGVNISRLALQFSLAEPRIATTLVGMGSVQQVRDNVACVGTPPDAELLAEVQSLLASVHNLIWASGRPENN